MKTVKTEIMREDLVGQDQPTTVATSIGGGTGLGGKASGEVQATAGKDSGRRGCFSPGTDGGDSSSSSSRSNWPGTGGGSSGNRLSWNGQPASHPTDDPCPDPESDNLDGSTSGKTGSSRGTPSCGHSK